jgi:two-component system sensor histidine kinase AlgZ
MLLITSELLVLVLGIVQASDGWIDWNYFALLSLFVQWTTLTSAALICLLRQRLARISVPRATLAIAAIVLLDVLAFSLFADNVLHPQSGIIDWQAIA